ncbi:MAG: DUF362 domain-containing protein, partial [Candidatus Promineifilaceae bacterium]
MPVVSKSTAGAELRSAIIQTVFTLGGFESFVKPGDSVFLKPNFNSADPFPASTDICFLREVVQLVLEQDPSKVIIGESSAFNDNTTKIMEALGIPQLEDISPKVAVMDLNKSGW